MIDPEIKNDSFNLCGVDGSTVAQTDFKLPLAIEATINVKIMNNKLKDVKPQFI